jgi:RNA recognition motif-containing protein
MILFVGNLDHSATAKDLELLFSGYGTVLAVDLITDFVTRRSRGCAYVKMEDAAQAKHAMEKLNNTKYGQKTITVTDKGPRKTTFKDRP